jgi:hypothetical protein
MTFMSRGYDAAHIHDAGANVATEANIIRVMRYVYDEELGRPPNATDNPYWKLPKGTPGIKD